MVKTLPLTKFLKFGKEKVSQSSNSIKINTYYKKNKDFNFVLFDVLNQVDFNSGNKANANLQR